MGKSSFPGVRRPIPGAKTGGPPGARTPGTSSHLYASRVLASQKAKPWRGSLPLPLGPQPDPAPSQGRGQVWLRPCSQTQPLFNAWKVARDTGSRPGVPLGTRKSPGWPDPPPQLCAAGTRGERKKNQPLRDLEDSVVLSRKYTEITIFTQFAGASLRLMAVNCF